jgi:hypothetical protein
MKRRVPYPPLPPDKPRPFEKACSGDDEDVRVVACVASLIPHHATTSDGLTDGRPRPLDPPPPPPPPLGRGSLLQSARVHLLVLVPHLVVQLLSLWRASQVS